MESESAVRPIEDMDRPRDINAKIADFVKNVTEVGPDIPLIAKQMGEHKESVRYWFKKLLSKGFVIQPSINFEKLGLMRMIVVADFAREYEPQAEPILIAMSQLCYVQSFVKTLPDGHYLIHGAVPTEYVGQWTEMMRRLQEMGMFTSIEFSTYQSARNAPMKSELYDFEAERWDFEWSVPAKVYPELLEPPAEKEHIDRIDLEIINRLQRDETRSLSDIQKDTKINYKTLSFHYRKHIMGKQLLKGHKVNWIGTGYNPASERGKHKRHTYQPVDLVLTDVTPSEKATIMGLTNALPFLWWEAVGRNSYAAQLVFPTESISEAMQFLERALMPVRERARWFMGDMRHSMALGLEPKLFDAETKQWKFEQAELLAKFENLLLEIKGQL